MKRLAVLLVFLLAGAAFGEIREFRYYSLDVPEEWSVSEEGAVVTITAPDRSCSLAITADEPRGKSIEELARSFALELNGSVPEKDDDGGYTFEFNNGVSHAVIDGDDELYLLIIGTGIENNADILGQILGSLEMK